MRGVAMFDAFFRLGSALALYAALAQLLFIATAQAAGDLEELYSARTVITGASLEDEKLRGFAECLEQVLIKVSGDSSLAGTPAVVALAAQAEEFVEDYDLSDRMAAIPVHDEQGTRERPHTLTVRFSPEAINRALEQLGLAPWLDRPTIALAIDVDNGAQRSLLTHNADFGADQRSAIEEAGNRLGLTLTFPEGAAQTNLAGNPARGSEKDLEQLLNLAREAGGEALLAGFLVWDEQALRWTSQWELVWNASPTRWEISAMSFDMIFDDTLEKTLALLSAEARG